MRVVVMLLLVVVWSPVSAEPTTVYGHYQIGPYSVSGDLADELRGGWFRAELNGGLHLGWFAIGLGVEGLLGSTAGRQSRERTEVLGLLAGPEVRLFHGPTLGSKVYARLALRRVWLEYEDGDSCGVPEDCYVAAAPTATVRAGSVARFGLGLQLIPPGVRWRDWLYGFSAEATYDHWRLSSVGGPSRTGHVVSFSIGVLYELGDLRRAR